MLISMELKCRWVHLLCSGYSRWLDASLHSYHLGIAADRIHCPNDAKQPRVQGSVVLLLEPVPEWLHIPSLCITDSSKTPNWKLSWMFLFTQYLDVSHPDRCSQCWCNKYRWLCSIFTAYIYLSMQNPRTSQVVKLNLSVLALQSGILLGITRPGVLLYEVGPSISESTLRSDQQPQ